MIKGFRLILVLIAFLILGISLYASWTQSNTIKQSDIGETQSPSPVPSPMATGTPSPIPTIQPRSKSAGFAKVSWYNHTACGEREYGSTCKTANGEIFNESDFTIAHRSLRFGTVVLFRNGSRSVQCRVNDRGPFIPGREFDLAWGCANELGIIHGGVKEITWEIINWRN